MRDVEQPIPSTSQCRNGETWTLDFEAADIQREIHARENGEVFVADAGYHFLGYVGPHKNAEFIAHLMNGRLRAAMQRVADGAFRIGISEAHRLFAEGRVKGIKGKPSGMGYVEFHPQRIPPQIGIILSYAIHQKVQRAELVRVLRKGGKVQLWGMRSAVIMPPLSQQDVNDILSNWPYRSKRGRPRTGRQ